VGLGVRPVDVSLAQSKHQQVLVLIPIIGIHPEQASIRIRQNPHINRKITIQNQLIGTVVEAGQTDGLGDVEEKTAVADWERVEEVEVGVEATWVPAELDV